jgi:MFS family permease
MLTALTLGWAIIYADRTCLYPLLIVIAAQLGLTSVQLGSLTSTYFLFYVLMQIPAGLLGDKYGLKTVMVGLYGVAAIGLLGLGILGASYELLLFFAALHGLGAGAYYPTAYGTVLQVVSPERRGVSSAVVGIGMAVGLMLGLTVSGPVYDVLGSYRAPFIILSIPTFLILIYFLRAIPNIRGTISPAWAEYKKVLFDKDLMLINLGTLLALYGFWVLITWGPSFLKVERDFSLGQAGFYTGLIAISAVPAGLVWGKLSDLYGRKRLAILTLPLGAITLIAISAFRDPVAIVISLLLFGAFSNSAFTPIMVAWTGDIVSTRYPGMMGAAVGIFNSIIMVAAIAAPTISGYIRDITGSLSWAFIIGSAAMAVGTVFFLFVSVSGERVYREISG